MIHQCVLIFHDKSLFQFNQSQKNKTYQLSEEYTFNLSVKRTSLVFSDDHQQIFHLSSKHVQTNPHKHGQKETILYNIPNDSKIQKKPILTIKASSKCLEYISESTGKNKAFKCSLAFVPSHVKHISILSGESPEQKYRGFLNLIGIMFIILNIRNIIDNFMRYGVQFHKNPTDFVPLHALIAIISLSVFPLTAYAIQKIKIKKLLPQVICKAFLSINIALILVFNIGYCRIFSLSPFIGVFFTSICMIIFLKLVSFYQVAGELYSIIQRLKLQNDIESPQENSQETKPKQKNKKKSAKTPKLQKKSSKAEINEQMFAHYQISAYNLNLIQSYSGNWDKIISLQKIIYFMFAPTLCYQLEYPRTEKIRVVWLTKRIVEFFFVSALQVLLWIQYIQPQLQNMYEKLIVQGNFDFLQIVSQHLRLAVPNTIMWVAGFYNCFHLMLNISAELLRFDDRKFYMDWWNCRTLQEYWKTWNLPVHFWFIRHVYNPLLQKGFSKASANFIVFFISAVAHEYVVSVPLKLITFWGFLAMVSQGPMIYIQKKFGKILKLEDSQLGNVSFWVFFCVVGQPIIVFIYYTLYIQKYSQTGGLFEQIPLKFDL